MDDAVVHRVKLLDDYNVNLLFYRRENVPIQTWNIYVDFLPQWNDQYFGCRNRNQGQGGGLDMSNGLNFEPGRFSKALPLRPALITHEENVGTATPGTSQLRPENPSRVQPKRNVTDVSDLIPDTDSESPSSPPSDKEDYEYVPPPNKGICKPMNT